MCSQAAAMAATSLEFHSQGAGKPKGKNPKLTAANICLGIQDSEFRGAG
ncbi:hypothetical protein [Desulfobacter latus]|uniref:Uncharacterized protein n=1 Tax=Desulfobacter latus TaxID=2292 RepID=A0A850SXL0_9BACT|nr:hypothetical protein [Desulfobacter latus]NWH05889.1 hypothetical protein [Desulfobacter latus]